MYLRKVRVSREAVYNTPVNGRRVCKHDKMVNEKTNTTFDGCTIALRCMKLSRWNGIFNFPYRSSWKIAETNFTFAAPTDCKQLHRDLIPVLSLKSCYVYRRLKHTSVCTVTSTRSWFTRILYGFHNTLRVKHPLGLLEEAAGTCTCLWSINHP